MQFHAFDFSRHNSALSVHNVNIASLTKRTFSRHGVDTILTPRCSCMGCYRRKYQANTLQNVVKWGIQNDCRN